ncbi:peptidoglycan D,D-transpeptidase FtsI family protein [Oharaeibacter diazotrophicus]|uniref:Cell division protein FtsI (Penicillin-binding protein 3) n=1 Tax=Oharaeibacter diazotrophicus TaxID=1920512 RepID=A0A4R6RGS8_9HYPH|nr:penicillin-binding protein 2 [Oharaeibacter diazotrophicus]TDP85530.1 cell division protein FtsI (penicillin-binding protein 3) [Oharaeibacter diazotrophicus]BBE74501.1 peptidoglycan synthase FtsI [Pleomorphomonas sp. SM30]GLS75800.1 cell division protein [Oharaeibacter diazotrophicus]
MPNAPSLPTASKLRALLPWRRRAVRREKPSPGDTTRSRLILAMGAFVLVYGTIGARLVQFGLAEPADPAVLGNAQAAIAAARPDIVDRNGEILATDIKTASLYAEPRRIVDPDEATELLGTVFPELGTDATRQKLASRQGFVWLKREITPQQQEAVHKLGLPGIGFLSESKRFYPSGRSVGYVVGHVNIDNQGIAGIEKYIDDQWLGDLHKLGFAMTPNLEPIKLTLDLRVQHVLHDELSSAMERYTAIGAAGVVMNVKTGEVVAMASMPDYDPNNPVEALDPNKMNRASAAVFEMGSTFKLFATAMALDSGKVRLTDSFDASAPLRIGGFTIHDFHGKHRVLTVPEVFIYSSNVGTGKEALRVGQAGQQEFLRRIGLMDKVPTELPEIARPILPKRWSDLVTVTVSFGHGISVSPLATAMSASAVMNGGLLIPPTFFPRSEEKARLMATRVLKQQTSDEMRYLMRLNVLKGSGTRANIPGYRVGGKTGTAEKVVNGRYSANKRFNAFLASFPIDDPQYLVLVVLDEPNPEKPGVGATAGLNAAPTASNVISRIAPMLGVMPRFDDADRPLMVSF